MARIFNIYFDYDNRVHSAMVSVRSTPFFTEYTLNNIPDSLMKQLPGNKIVSTPNGFTFQHTDLRNASPLMQSIIRAVAEHLHATEA